MVSVSCGISIKNTVDPGHAAYIGAILLELFDQGLLYLLMYILLQEIFSVSFEVLTFKYP
jgi:hypothetical protein